MTPEPATAGWGSSVTEFHPWRVFDPDDSGSLVGEIRRRRWARLIEHFPDLASMRVLDLGGTPRAWAAAPVRPERLVVLNCAPSGFDDSVAAEIVAADACDPPGRVLNDDFDLVYSNSVLEHVGGHERRKRFSDTVRRAAPRHWIQTPYRYFPVEPHVLFPGYQFLPLATRAVVGRHWGPARRSVHAMPPRDQIDFAQSIELLSATDLAAYFPDAAIVRERFGGMVKSLIAVR